MEYKIDLKWTQNEEQTIKLAYATCNNCCFMFELLKHILTTIE